MNTGNQGIHAQDQVTVSRRRDDGGIISDPEDNVGTPDCSLRAIEITPDEFEF
jgi:hypothetical protein